MAINIIEKKVSENRKRIDAKLKVTSFFKDPWQLSLRILGYQAIPEEEEEEIFEQVVKRRKEWKQNKRNQSLNLSSYNATAFILKVEEYEPSEDN
jgi:hypothetical protein